VNQELEAITDVNNSTQNDLTAHHCISE